MRRIKVSLVASGDGLSCSSSRRESTNASIEFLIQPSSETSGTGGLTGAVNAQCVFASIPTVGPPSRIHSSSTSICLPASGLKPNGICGRPSSPLIRRMISEFSGSLGSNSGPLVPPNLTPLAVERSSSPAGSSPEWQLMQLVLNSRSTSCGKFTVGSGVCAPSSIHRRISAISLAGSASPGAGMSGRRERGLIRCTSNDPAGSPATIIEPFSPPARIPAIESISRPPCASIELWHGRHFASKMGWMSFSKLTGV